MVIRRTSIRKAAALVATVALLVVTPAQAATAGPSPLALASFDKYVAQSETQIQQEESASDTFLGVQSFPSPSPDALEARLRRGEIVVTSGGITPLAVPGGLIHHWIGIVFIPQTNIAQVFAILQNYDQMARYYSPDVAASRLIKRHGDDFKISMRLREHKIITVMLDGLYDVKYGQLDEAHQFCASRSMQMVEVSDDSDSSAGDASDAGEPSASGTDHGFLWRTNAYWRFQQADDGVFVEFESISLSRDVPTGWGWLIEPLIRDVPRESLLFTLRATRKAVLANESEAAEPQIEPLKHALSVLSANQKSFAEISQFPHRRHTRLSTIIELRNPAPANFRNAARVQEALTASVERNALAWLARRTPDRISPDHLTAFGFAAQFFAGAFYALARWHKYALLLVAVCIAANWLGDSLDGTLARHRQKLRPRYGFYVDHMVDTFGATFLVAGLVASSYMHWQIGIAMLVAFLVLSVETYLAAYTLHEFRLSHALFGPTELRILLIIGTIVLLFHPDTHLFGREFLLFDLGGAIATAGMMAMAIIAAIRHTMRLYAEERIS